MAAMKDELRTEFNRPVPIGLAALALLGWILMIYFWVSRAALQDELSQMQDNVGTIEVLEEQVAQLQADTQNMVVESQTAAAARDETQAQLEALEQEAQALEQQVDARQTALSGLEAELAPLRTELGSFEERLAEVEQSFATRTQELNDVGERLEAARNREAELQASLATLTDETAQLAAQSAEAEQRIQTAREAEASLENELIGARDEIERFAQERTRLQQTVAVLTRRAEELAGDNAAAVQQRDALQGVVTQLATDLAERGEQLAALEARIAQYQQMADEAAQAAFDARTQETDGATLPADADAPQDDAQAAVFGPGEYALGSLTAVFAPDGTFRLSNPAQGTSIQGQYRAEEGILILENATGDIARETFPVECDLVLIDGQITLEAQNGSCRAFDGLVLEPVG